MEQAIVSGIAFNRDEAKISVRGRALILPVLRTAFWVRWRCQY
jgi:hypothetical protein